MAEFKKVIEEFNRMCNYNQRKQQCPMGCPMSGVNISQCRKMAFEHPDETEATIMTWTYEHPVVYPSWWEWLASIGAVTLKVKLDIASELIETGLLDPIHEDIAQKLGIKPKEG